MQMHLDTNLLIDLVTAGSPHIAVVRRWLEEGVELCASAIAWSEFCNGPLSREQKDSIFAVLEGRVLDFTLKEAETASVLFHRTGRKRGSHADCMIASAAICRGVKIATRNLRDFERFEEFGIKLKKVPTEA
jgi:predicted nucleic acid-binding protein